jgi:glycine cleavage system protein P-like pyridoxal-binding family
MITKEQYLKANKDGLNGVDRSFYTPCLQVAYNLGLDGIDLNTAMMVNAFRYGQAPDAFISYNYAENIPESGLSVYTEESTVRAEFVDRKIYNYSGIVSGIGSDGEVLILAFEAENWD